MIVSIGMLAHNEEGGIETTIRSLLNQSVFRSRAADSGVSRWEIVVVPNGCEDRTAEVATNALEGAIGELQATNIVYSVQSLTQGGKSNAWNHYIHEMLCKDADTIVMVDSDIEFGHEDTIFNCIAELHSNTAAVVVVDTPLKDFVKRSDLSLLERMSARQSQITLEGDAAIAGSFYCARAATLRSVWMPVGLPGEDGFLRGMIVTDFFRSPPDASRVVRAKNATHYYEGLNDLRSIFRHELRMVIGTAINCYLMWDFLSYATDPKGPGAGQLIRHQIEADPHWLRKLIDLQIRNRGLFVLPHGMLLRRFSRLRGLGFGAALKRLPLAVAGFLLDVPVFFMANRMLRRGTGLGFW